MVLTVFVIINILFIQQDPDSSHLSYEEYINTLNFANEIILFAIS